MEIEEMILNKITKTLREEFSSDEIVSLYNDHTPQNFTKPAIVVLEYDEQERHLLNQNSEYYVWFDISIHPKDETTLYRQMRKYAPRISRVLDYITLEKEYTKSTDIKLKKLEFSWSVQDGVGHINIGYMYRAKTRDTNQIIPITSVSGNQYIKEDK